MDEKEIEKKITILEEELKLFQSEKQREVDKFMLESGLTNFINDVAIRVSKMQGKIEALKELLPERKEEG